MKCIMITGDNPLTAVHVAQDVEIVDRDVLILDVQENAPSSSGADSQCFAALAVVILIGIIMQVYMEGH